MRSALGKGKQGELGTLGWGVGQGGSDFDKMTFEQSPMVIGKSIGAEEIASATAVKWRYAWLGLLGDKQDIQLNLTVR